MQAEVKPVRAEEVLDLHARTGQRYEVVEGVPREMPPTGGEHGEIELEVGYVLRRSPEIRRLGRVVVGEVLFRLKRNPELDRAAEVAFICLDRLVGGRVPSGPIEGARTSRSKSSPPTISPARSRKRFSSGSTGEPSLSGCSIPRPAAW